MVVRKYDESVSLEPYPFVIEELSTTGPVDSDTHCCLTREPSGASRLNRTSNALSVAKYKMTGMEK
jgi:hypothetical protein